MKKIKKTSGYPTSDGTVHDVHADAVKHQTDIDLIESCKESGQDADAVKAFLQTNTEVVKDYIAKHLTEKPAAKPAVKKKPAPDKGK